MDGKKSPTTKPGNFSDDLIVRSEKINAEAREAIRVGKESLAPYVPPAELTEEQKNSKQNISEAQPVRRFANSAPPPLNTVGVSYRLPRSKPTQAKLDWPSYFPNDLIAQATVILCKAAREHLVPTLEFYAQFISNLTPYLCGAVRSKALRTDLVILGMGVVLDSLLVYNCDDEERRFRLKQELMVSDAWMKLAEKMAGVPSAAVNDSSDIHLEGETPNRERLQVREEAPAAQRAPTSKKNRQFKGLEGLPKKPETETERLIDAARLTKRQHECASLRWVYQQDVTEIARRLELKSRKSVQVHLRAAKAKMDSDRAKLRRGHGVRTSPATTNL